MKSLGRKVLIASLGGLLLLGGLYVLVSHEMRAWNEASTYVMRDYRRATFDGELHAALTRAAGEAASYVLTGNERYRGEAAEALGRARVAAGRLREIADEGPSARGDARHIQFLARQERLLKATETVLEEALAEAASAGGRLEAAALDRIYAYEVETDELWQQIVSHHRDEQGENMDLLRRRSERARAFFLTGVVACLLAAGLLMAYVRQRVVRPLAALARSARSVAAGDLTHRVAVTHGDEIGQLQRSFNEMVVDLDHQRRHRTTLIERLAASRDAAHEASRAKSDFLANVSHEIRTPMNGLLVGLDLLHETAPDREQRDLAEMLRTSARHLLGMINDLIDFSRIDAGRMELESIVFEPHRLVTQLIELHGKRATEKGVAMSCAIDSDVPERVRGDPTRFGQVLLNLLDNAIKYTEKGSIAVSVRTVADDPEAGPSAPAPGPDPRTVLLSVHVADTGAGIPAGAESRIFEPFYQASGQAGGAYEGIGLGLSIARQLTRMMGGELRFDSEVGKGSTFWFTTRLQREEERPGAETEAAAPALPTGRAILLVEDHPDTREIMARTLRRRGLHVAVAENGRVALDLALAQDFDVILMDCKMREMDGFEATRAIRAAGGHRARVPIIALTAYGLSGPKQSYLDAGFDDLVVKPYTIEEVETMLQRWLDPARSPAAAAAARAGASGSRS